MTNAPNPDKHAAALVELHDIATARWTARFNAGIAGGDYWRRVAARVDEIATARVAAKEGYSWD